MAGQDDWRAAAFEVYRAGWLELEQWKGRQAKDVEYYLEELKEALLDLKQATLAEDAARALDYMSEIRLILAELDR